MKNNLIIVIISFAIIIIFFDGCASLLKGVNEEVNIISEPNGAKVYVNGQMLGKTPLQIKLSAKNTHYIEFVKDGYEKKTFILSSSVEGQWIILDIIFGLFPVIIDAATGSWYNFDNNYAGVFLEKNISDIDSLNIQESDSKIIVSTPSENKSPSFTTIQLKSDEEEIIFDGKISLVYKSSGWDKSLLSAKGIWGFSENLNGPFNEISIPIFKRDIIYMKVDSNTIYRIEVIQEVLNNLSIVFIKL